MPEAVAHRLVLAGGLGGLWALAGALSNCWLASVEVPARWLVTCAGGKIRAFVMPGCGVVLMAAPSAAPG